MVCESPIWLTKGLDPQKFPAGLFVPCGHCVNCRSARAKEWAMRLQHELHYWHSAVFVTLTYDNDHVPDKYSLRKSDLQKFLKRLRKHLGKKKIKYYAAGEYGEQHHRPHYHLVIFGLNPPTTHIENGMIVETPNSGCREIIEDCWTYGHIDIGGVTPASIAYVTQYVTKKIVGKAAEDAYKKVGREPPWHIVSQGMGLRYALDNNNRLYDDMYDTVSGKERCLPRYYRSKLQIDPKRLQKKSEEGEQNIMTEYYKRHPKSSLATYRAWTHDRRRQIAIDRSKKIDLKKRSGKNDSL